MKEEAGSKATLHFRLVAADVDGTILDERGHLTPSVQRTIRAAQAAGVVISLATSRRLTGAAPVAEELGLCAPLILYDGAQVRAFPSGEVLISKPLPAQIGQEVIHILSEHGLQPIVQHADGSREHLLVGSHKQVPWHSTVYLARFTQQIVELPVAQLCVGQPDPVRILAFGSLDTLRLAACDVSRLACGWQLLERGNFGSSELTIFAQEASKGTALMWLVQHLDVPLEQTLAIGDGINDVSMLRAAGLGVAMGNAGSVTKAAAHVVTGANGEDGVAQALSRFVLRG